MDKINKKTFNWLPMLAFVFMTLIFVQVVSAALVEGTNYGFVTSAPTADPEGAGSSAISSRARFFKVLATEAGTITEMGVYVNAVSEAANCQLGIYSSDEANNRAANRLARSADFAKGTTAGWKTAAVDYTFTADTNYFLAVQCDNTATVTWIDITGNGLGRSEYFTVQDELAASYGAPSGFGTFEISIYALYTTGGAENYAFTLLMPSSGCTTAKGGNGACVRAWFDYNGTQGNQDINAVQPEGQTSTLPFWIIDNQSSTSSDFNLSLDLNATLPTNMVFKASKNYTGYLGACTSYINNCIVIDDSNKNVGTATYSAGTQDFNLFLWTDFIDGGTLGKTDRNIGIWSYDTT